MGKIKRKRKEKPDERFPSSEMIKAIKMLPALYPKAIAQWAAVFRNQFPAEGRQSYRRFKTRPVADDAKPDALDRTPVEAGPASGVTAHLPYQKKTDNCPTGKERIK